MQIINIAGTTLRISKFIFGTASLFNAGNQKRRAAILESALDNGFTHFDTAPYYGFGMAERDLSYLLKRHPQVTVTTKVGIYSPGGEEQAAFSILLRKAFGKLLPGLSMPTINFSLDRAQTALEGSLRRMGRDYVDIYMLHEPSFELLQTDEWLRWFEKRRMAGQIRYYGLAMGANKLLPFLEDNSPLANVIQMADSLDQREADVLANFGRPMQITYSYVTAARARGDTRSTVELLRDAVGRNSSGAIIVSTRRPSRMGQYRDLLEAAK